MLKSVRNLHRRGRAAGLGAGLLLTLVLVCSSLAHAERPSYEYSFGGPNCPNNPRPNHFVDPIGAVFRGTGASYKRVAHVLDNVAGWGYFTDSNEQTTYVRGGAQGNVYVCNGNTGSRADHGNVPPSSRYHIRLWEAPFTTSSGVHWTVGTPHHEDLVKHVDWPPACHAIDKNGDTGSGFDKGRAKLVRKLSGSFTNIHYAYWGNTQTMKQCDGDYAGSNGKVAVIQIGKYP